jgi:ferrous iron transport protein B
MLFILIYFPCIAVIAAIKKEGNWKWAVFTMFYTTAIAYIVFAVDLPNWEFIYLKN